MTARDRVTVTLDFDSSSVDSLITEIKALAEKSPDFAEAFCTAFDAGEELFSLKSDVVSTDGASEVMVRVNPSHRLSGLFAAARAGD